jgi:hypothetical protein
MRFCALRSAASRLHRHLKRAAVLRHYGTQSDKRDLEIDLFRSKRDLLTTSHTLQLASAPLSNSRAS